MRLALHLALVAVAQAVVVAAIVLAFHAPALIVTTVVFATWWLGGSLLLPRVAHGAFRIGRTRRALRAYRTLAIVSPSLRPAALVSIAGCYLIEHNWDRAQEALAAIDGDRLPALLRAAWLNNRAYAIARGGLRDAADPLALVDQALALRPGVPSFLHTRGLALLAADRVDDAIRAFEAVWEAGEVEPTLEAERCHDLARAWDAKGQRDYAADYRRRSVQAAPGSLWAAASGAHGDLAALESQIA